MLVKAAVPVAPAVAWTQSATPAASFGIPPGLCTRFDAGVGGHTVIVPLFGIPATRITVVSATVVVTVGAVAVALAPVAMPEASMGVRGIRPRVAQDGPRHPDVGAQGEHVVGGRDVGGGGHPVEDGQGLVGAVVGLLDLGQRRGR